MNQHKSIILANRAQWIGKFLFIHPGIKLGVFYNSIIDYCLFTIILNLLSPDRENLCVCVFYHGGGAMIVAAIAAVILRLTQVKIQPKLSHQSILKLEKTIVTTKITTINISKHVDCTMYKINSPSTVQFCNDRLTFQ